jgi:transcriptional regulator with XRE-family HTH domain
MRAQDGEGHMPQLTLEQHRIRAYLTIEELANKAGVSAKTVQRIQRGNRPKLTTIRKIASVLNVHPDEVVEFSTLNGDDRTGQDTSDFYKQHTVEMLAKEQGVKPITDFNSLLGDFWPEDESIEDFIKTIRQWRDEGNGDDLPTGSAP